MTAAVERMRVAIIGPGRISDLHAIEYVNSPYTEIAAVCKPDTAGALARARSWGIEPEKVYADWQDCLADDSIDAFEVLLPHHMHLEVALAALATGKHLSIQKPVGFTVAECQQFVEAADAATARGQVVRVFENFLFYPPVARLVEIVRAGEIGDVLSIRQKSLSGDPACGWEVPARAAEWRFDLERNGGGPLVFDDGLHKFSIFWSMLGVADEVHAWIGSTPVEGGALDSPSVVSLRWASGAVGALEVVNAPKLQVQSIFYSQDDRVEVSGTKGVAWVNRGHGKIQELPALQVYKDGRTTDYEDLPSEWDSSFILATRDFIEAVREGRSSLLTAAQHREVLSTALAAQISAREDRVVRPAEVGLGSARGTRARLDARPSRRAYAGDAAGRRAWSAARSAASAMVSMSRTAAAAGCVMAGRRISSGSRATISAIGRWAASEMSERRRREARCGSCRWAGKPWPSASVKSWSRRRRRFSSPAQPQPWLSDSEMTLPALMRAKRKASSEVSRCPHVDARVLHHGVHVALPRATPADDHVHAAGRQQQRRDEPRVDVLELRLLALLRHAGVDDVQPASLQRGHDERVLVDGAGLVDHCHAHRSGLLPRHRRSAGWAGGRGSSSQVGA